MNAIIVGAVAALCLLPALCVGAGDEDAGAPKTDSDAEWARTLFPDRPDPLGLAVVASESVSGGVEVICALTYRDIHGEPATGHVKLYLPDALRDDPDAPLPLIHFAGYEMDRAGGEALLATGTMLSTPHGEEPNPLVRGENLDVAILHRLRALPFVDDRKFEIFGGSAGGYMTLLLAAETFPLNACAPDVPAVNLGYNIAYIAHNKPLAHAQPEGQDHPNMPVVTVVTPLADEAELIYGSDFDGDAYLAASPISRLDEITCPTLIIASTADALVPIDQFGRDLVRPFDPVLLPTGFETAIDSLMTRKTAQRTLLDVLPPEQIEVFEVPVPPESPRIGWDGAPSPGAPAHLEIPFSEDKQFSLAVLDEGPPEPQCGHTKYGVNIDKNQFLALHRDRAIGPEQLTLAKLTRLMQRTLGVEGHAELVRTPGTPGPFVANRLDFPEAERADVLRGLRVYAADDECRSRLVELYASLPESLKALGDDVEAALQE